MLNLILMMTINKKTIMASIVTGTISSLFYGIFYLVICTNILWAKSDGVEMWIALPVLIIIFPVAWIINLMIPSNFSSWCLFVSGIVEFFLIGFFIRWIQLKLRERDQERGFY